MLFSSGGDPSVFYHGSFVDSFTHSLCSHHFVCHFGQLTRDCGRLAKSKIKDLDKLLCCLVGTGRYTRSTLCYEFQCKPDFDWSLVVGTSDV